MPALDIAFNLLVLPGLQAAPPPVSLWPLVELLLPSNSLAVVDNVLWIVLGVGFWRSAPRGVKMRVRAEVASER